SDDVEAMFSTPVVVFKDGVVVAREGEIVAEPRGRTLRAVPPRAAAGKTRAAFERTIRDRFETTMTMPFEDFPVPEDDRERASPGGEH
ncbi:MAG TPA: hypothetical protein VEO94_04875, partial [Candidatus Dormibacteraeota bacterium]|nr:hypothetical protein [Candidatus Dormibacteraeota bacterium]